jgi:4-amino-4-deoxy-L-arabinose transferase-like glycosyltransferase
MELTFALGLLLRIGAYLWDRHYWLDEGSLLESIRRVQIFNFSGPLHNDQLAPFGFLIIERALVGLLGDSRYVMRLFPLWCGLASLCLFRSLASRCLNARSALLALAFFTFSDDIVYYSSELKPYSLDVLFAVAITLGAVRLLESPVQTRELLALVLLVVLAPWFSFPSAFFVGGCGLVLLWDRTRRCQMRELSLLLGVAVCWLCSFVAAYRASHALLGPSTSMYIFWGFAFLPAPPHNLNELFRFASILLEFFVNPLYLLAPFMPRLAVAVPILLAMAGAVVIHRRNNLHFLMLTLPVLLALLAAAVQKYPFHGRLILSLVPAFYLLVADGTEAVRGRFGKTAAMAVLILVLLYPCVHTLYQATGKRVRDYSVHGDLHVNRFDYY